MTNLKLWFQSKYRIALCVEVWKTW